MAQTTISKAQMLASIAESGDIPFRIQYVKATGKEAGKISEKVCYYGAPNPYPRGKTVIPVIPKRAPRKSHLESNSIPLTEFGSNRMLTPFISHIITYNGHQVIH